ncbi:MAG: CocE/NonD family hydrolase [Candidatus Eisenbacteria bacterium]|uniref:CocE/NonD family hydrolase n=1 Tax=Eiseniibacteriota bacterium TaxID=2212470 RepID=A0A956M0K4_UNCEI|nr:CocE/NonD family hydrolase [Candidatus Eisenbacteria bacterium]
MLERDDLPHEIREIENLWIPLSDGVHLAARFWLPADAADAPVPAILEYIPYRKRDATRWRDEPMHRYFAGHGYAAVRVDLRGCGDSEGLLLDEYHPREQADALEVLRWIAAQPWCSGKVGMIGKSWGGFSALQVAALRPPELAAVIAVCATDDRYADDAHYMGGCLLNENLVWGAMLFTITAQPPDPALPRPESDAPEAAWRAEWLERLEHTVLFPEIWLSHPERDAYWRHGSICEEYAAVRCPVYAVSGWADGYTNAVPRLLAGLSAPRKGLIGPWGHRYPHNGAPGPAIGFLQESLRWWDRWLRDEDTGILDEPRYRVWMQDSLDGPAARAVASHEADQPGRWVAEDDWPSPRIELVPWSLRPAGASSTPPIGLAGSGSLRPGPAEHEVELRMSGDAPAGAIVSLRTDPSVGSHAAAWCSFGIEGELPVDTIEDDRRSLIFQSDPFASATELLGNPVLHLCVSGSCTAGMVVARLVAVAPDGSGTRISFGMTTLAESPTDRLEPAYRVEAARGVEPVGGVEPTGSGDARSDRMVRIELKHLGQRIPVGFSLRLALSTSYWPMVWPSVRDGDVPIRIDQCRLDLPVRPTNAIDDSLPPFAPPEAAPAGDMVDVHPGGLSRTYSFDAATREHRHRHELDLDETGAPARTLLREIGLEIGHSIIEEFTIRDDDPRSARAAILQRIHLAREDWRVEIETAVTQRASGRNLVLEARLEARENGQPVFTRQWTRHIPIADTIHRDEPRTTE